MIPGETVFWLPEPAMATELFTDVAAQFESRREGIVRQQFSYFDTFDWRLDEAGWSLRAESVSGGWQFDLKPRRLSPTSRERKRRPERMSTTPAFVWDLPEGSLRSLLEPIVEMRRLLPVVSVERRSRSLRILDAEAKTRARVRLEKIVVNDTSRSSSRSPLLSRIRVIPLKGYEKTARQVVRWLESRDGVESGGGSTFDRALTSVGRATGDYTSKLDLDLEPSMAAGPAMAAVYGRLLEVMRANEAGVRGDLDSEFLHDFRVAVRRTRAGLGQLKACLPVAEVASFRAEFSWLGEITGPTRDLDVYLLKMPIYRASLPAAAATALEPLNVFLGQRQKEAQRLLSRRLRSGRYRTLVAGWAAFLERVAAGDEVGEVGEKPIRAVASGRIWKTYRRVLRRGGAIETGSPAEAIHRLRIDCKKLRYLMEFFRGLYPAREISVSIKALKRLQDNLGDFNDYEVQQASLMEFSEQMVANDLAPVKTLVAMGRLVERLERGQQRERQRFHERFERFAATKNHVHFQRLFKNSRRRETVR